MSFAASASLYKTQCVETARGDSFDSLHDSRVPASHHRGAICTYSDVVCPVDSIIPHKIIQCIKNVLYRCCRPKFFAKTKKIPPLSLSPTHSARTSVDVTFWTRLSTHPIVWRSHCHGGARCIVPLCPRT